MNWLLPCVLCLTLLAFPCQGVANTGANDISPQSRPTPSTIAQGKAAPTPSGPLIPLPSSELGFTGSYQGMQFTGQFPGFTARITYAPDDLAHAQFDVRIPLGKVSTRNRERDQVLTGDEFFDVARFPDAHFLTHSFTRDAVGQVTAHGTLTLRGIRHPLDLAVRFTPTEVGGTLDVQASVQRQDFDLGTDPDWNGISQAIQIHGHLQLVYASNSRTDAASNGQSSSRPVSSSRSTGKRVP